MSQCTQKFNAIFFHVRNCLCMFSLSLLENLSGHNDNFIFFECWYQLDHLGNEKSIQKIHVIHPPWDSVTNTMIINRSCTCLVNRYCSSISWNYVHAATININRYETEIPSQVKGFTSLQQCDAIWDEYSEDLNRFCPISTWMHLKLQSTAYFKILPSFYLVIALSIENFCIL